MRKLIKKPSEMGKQITCTTQYPLSSSFPSPPPKVRNDKAEWVIGSKQSAAAEWVCLYLVALMPFILLHCSTKMLPKQQEGLVHVMMALVKPLIVCIWVELELVIGDHTITHCLISEPLPRKLVYSWWRGKFPFFQVYLWLPYEAFLRRIISAW